MTDRGLDPEALPDALQALGSQLELQGASPLTIAVCGGSALNALGLVARTTRDVDVLGVVDEGSSTVSPGPLPDEFWRAARLVARDLGLPDDWINAEVAKLAATGLPSGLVDRLVYRQYGSVLRVGFISRLDQIHLKMYAAADRAGYHVDDLLALKPEFEELLSAARWCLEQDPSEGFETILRDMLRKLGFEDVEREL